MADVTLQVHYITSGLGGGGNYLTGQYIRVIADGAAIRAELWTDATAGSYIDNPSGGPDLTGEVGQISVSSGTFNDVQYCDTTDLVYYTTTLIWPYAEYHLSVDHPSCAIVVCDLEIASYLVTNESTAGMGDGEIAIVATSSNGTIKYGYDPDFDYATGLTSPITGITTGTYTIYAKDAAGCTDLVSVFVGVDFFYGVRWRAEYDNVFPRGSSSRIDIEERDYVDAVVEVCCSETPFVLEYNPADNSQIVPSNAEIQLLIEQGEEGKFVDIQTAYDRQFIVRKYKDVGSGFEIEWVGYLTPYFYAEPYISDPFVVTIKAVDGLAVMADKAFIALSGEEYFGNMSVLQMVCECLKKLPIELNIRSCVNIFEENMDMAATDDPLAQAYMKSENFRGDKCGDVITNLLKPFTRAELFQSYGVWWIRTKEQSIDSTLDYREFDMDAVFVDNDTIASRQNMDFPTQTNRFFWTEKSQWLNYTRPYGSFIVTHDLDKDNNMIDSGGFELTDIDPSTNFFRGWQIFPTQANVTSGLEYVDNGESKGAFFFQWADSGDQSDNILATEEMEWHVTGNVFENKATHYKVKFKAYASPMFHTEWIRLGWKFRMVDTDTSDFYDWFPPSSPLGVRPDANVALINDIYIQNFNSWQTYEFYFFRLPGDIAAINFTHQFSLYFHDHKGRDFQSWAGLKAFTTTDLNEGKRFYVAESGSGAGDTYGMELQASSATESIPDVVEPTDFHATTNPRKWIKVAHYNADGDVAMIDRIMIDDFRISMVELDTLSPNFPLVDPPETVVYEQVVSTLNEAVFEDDVKSGDAPSIMGADYIYNGFFKLLDGTPTYRWGRTSVTESRYLLDIYLGHLAAQGAQSLRLLSGVGRADIQLGYINSLEDQIDDRKYRFTRFSLDDKQGSYDIELEETLTGADGESPPDVETITFDSTIHSFDEILLTFDHS